MIFEFLDAKKKRIATYTDNTLLDGTVRRELVGRVIKDSMDVEFTLDMLEPIKNATYILLGETGWFRVNPLFKIVDITYDNTLRVTSTSQTLDRSSEVPIHYDGTGSFYTRLKEASAKIGYEIEIDTVRSEQELADDVFDYIETETNLAEVIEAITQVIEGKAEFDTVIDGNAVAKTKLRISENMGKDYKDALIYGVNIESLRVEERVEDIVTAIEYTGMEIERSDGTTYTLTLERTSNDIPQTYLLPYSNRSVRLTEHTDEKNTKHYLLEDVDSTRTYGNYTNSSNKYAEPVIEVHSNTDIPTVEYLIEESIKELDGRSIPKTQYSIEATVTGLDVADNLGIQIPHLNINRHLPVLTVEYDMGGDYECAIVVGEHLPTELDKRFASLGAMSGGGGTDTKRGKLLTTVVHPREIIYTSRENLLPTSDNDSGVYVKWVETLSEPMYPELYDYFLSFDYVIHEGYEAVAFDLGINGGTFAGQYRDAKYLGDNGFLDYFGTKVADLGIDGSGGSVDIRLNDYWNFMNVDLAGTGTNKASTTRSNPLGVLEITKGNYIYPIVTVRNVGGTEYTLNYVDYGRFTPFTEEGKGKTRGYISKFTITKHERE